MLEKARIHRAMLDLDEKGAFAVSDVVRETGAAITTVRKYIDRDAHNGWLAAEAETRALGLGRPEKLYRFTRPGRRQAMREVDRAYAALANVHDAIPADAEPAALTAGRQILAGLEDLTLKRDVFTRRLGMAVAAFAAAAARGAGRIRADAERLGTAARDGLEQLAVVSDGDQASWEGARTRVLEHLKEAQQRTAIVIFNQLIALLQRQRHQLRNADPHWLEGLVRHFSSAVLKAVPGRRPTPILGLAPSMVSQPLDPLRFAANLRIPALLRDVDESRLVQPVAWSNSARKIDLRPPRLLAPLPRPAYAR